VHNIAKEHILLFIVIFIGVFLVAKTVKFPKEATVNVAIMQQKKGVISSVDTPKELSSTKKILVDSVDFIESGILEHPSLGTLGYSKNFFLNAKTNMSVKEAGSYQFLVRSDDGFRLKIDNKVACEHPLPRAMLLSTCNVTLKKGKHLFDLDYYQAAGQMGLKVEYQKNGFKDYIGRSSKLISFEVVK
jgi:hypothetical protein